MTQVVGKGEGGPRENSHHHSKLRPRHAFLMEDDGGRGGDDILTFVRLSQSTYNIIY